MDHGNSIDWSLGPSPAEQGRLDHMISALSSEDLVGLDWDMRIQNDESSASFQFEGVKQAFPFNGPTHQDYSSDLAVSLDNRHTVRNPSTQATDPLPFGFDLSAMEPSHEPSSLETQSLMSAEMLTEHTPSQADSGTSFLAASCSAPGISSTSKTQNWFDTMPSHQTVLFSGEPKPRKRPTPHNGTSVSHSPIDKRRVMAGKARPRKDIARLEMSLRPYLTTSPHSRQKAAILLRQLKLLIDEIELHGPTQPRPPSCLSSQSSNSSFTAGDVFSQDSLSSSGVLDSDYRTEGDTSSSCTPRPSIDDAKNEMSMDPETSRPQYNHRTVYECTMKDCYYSTHLECDWIRHEQGERHWPQERFMCLACPTPAWDANGNPICSFCFASSSSLSDLRSHYLQCVSARSDGKTFGRSDHFCKHLREKHRVEHTAQHTETWKYAVNSAWPRQCGFCGINFQSWEQRMKHIARDYKNGAKIGEWKLPFYTSKNLNQGQLDTNPGDNDSDDEGDSDDNNGKRPSGSFRRLIATRVYPAAQALTQTLGTYPGRRSQYQQMGRRKVTTSTIVGQSLNNQELNSSMESSRHVLAGFSASQRRISGRQTAQKVSVHGVHAVNVTKTFPLAPIVHYMLLSENLNLSRNPRAALLRPLLESKGTLLAARYVAKHRFNLSEGVFWMNSQLDHGVRASFWNIIEQIILEAPQINGPASRVFQRYLQNIAQDLHGRSRFLGEFPMLSYWKLTRVSKRGEDPAQFLRMASHARHPHSGVEVQILMSPRHMITPDFCRSSISHTSYSVQSSRRSSKARLQGCNETRNAQALRRDGIIKANDVPLEQEVSQVVPVGNPPANVDLGASLKDLKSKPDSFPLGLEPHTSMRGKISDAYSNPVYQSSQPNNSGNDRTLNKNGLAVEMVGQPSLGPDIEPEEIHYQEISSHQELQSMPGNVQKEVVSKKKISFVAEDGSQRQLQLWVYENSNAEITMSERLYRSCW